jgi:serine/threonine protein kinase
MDSRDRIARPGTKAPASPSQNRGQPIQLPATMDVALPEGSLFAGRYRIDHLIGEGPRKQTYRAWDSKAHRQVALAVMLPGADPLATHREVEMLGKVCPHPNIVTLHEADLDAEAPYLVFEYIPGGELRDYCRDLQSQGRNIPLRDFSVPPVSYAGRSRRSTGAGSSTGTSRRPTSG